MIGNINTIVDILIKGEETGARMIAINENNTLKQDYKFTKNEDGTVSLRRLFRLPNGKDSIRDIVFDTKGRMINTRTQDGKIIVQKVYDDKGSEYTNDKIIIKSSFIDENTKKRKIVFKSNGKVTEKTYKYIDGELQYIDSEDDRVTYDRSYDEEGRVKQLIVTSKIARHVSTYEYSDNGITVYMNREVESDDGIDILKSEFYYDTSTGTRRLIKSVDGDSIIEYEYDERGLICKKNMQDENNVKSFRDITVTFRK